MTDELALAARAGLPDPLRVLVLRYPRIGWEAHPHFTALTRFWLDRHLGFRRMQGLLVDDTRGFLDRAREPQAYASRLYRVASRFLGDLHGHHNVEDHQYFPMLRVLDARIAPGFDLLDADHQALDAAIHDLAEAANAVLAAIRDDAPAEAAAAALDGRLAAFGRLLDRHLIDEEELRGAGDPRPPGGGALMLVALLSAANFVIGMGAFVVLGILSPMADGLGMSIAEAGHVLTVYVLAYAASSPLLVAATGGLSRRSRRG